MEKPPSQALPPPADGRAAHECCLLVKPRLLWCQVRVTASVASCRLVNLSFRLPAED